MEVGFRGWTGIYIHFYYNLDPIIFKGMQLLSHSECFMIN